MEQKIRLAVVGLGSEEVLAFWRWFIWSIRMWNIRWYATCMKTGVRMGRSH